MYTTLSKKAKKVSHNQELRTWYKTLSFPQRKVFRAKIYSEILNDLPIYKRKFQFNNWMQGKSNIKFSSNRQIISTIAFQLSGVEINLFAEYES